MTPGPRRYLVSGRYVTWPEWAGLLAEASGQPVPYTPATPDELIALGRTFYELRAGGMDLPPVSEEAAIIMSSGCPGDDTATLTDLGLSYRPAIETFRDAMAWLRAVGHLSHAAQPGGART